MEINVNKGNVRRHSERGSSLVELMIAMLVLLVGLVGSMSLVAVAIGGNGRSRQQSNSTAITQMVTEKISSVKASTSPDLTITDCTGANLTVSTGAGGSALLPSGDVDFAQAALPNYSMVYTACGTNGRQMTYDVRWNVNQVTPYVKFLTVSAKMLNAGNDLKMFSRPVTIRTLVGQGT